MMNSSEKLAVADFLKKAAGLGWSGMLRANRAGKRVGVVVMHNGRVAWAASEGMAEDFSSVLERVGLVSRDKLIAAAHTLQNHRRTEKIGSLEALLVEECLVSVAVLRTCFKTHVKAAVASLVATPRLALQADNETIAIDENLVFDLSDVLSGPEPGFIAPPAPIPLSQRSASADGIAMDELLTGLVSLPGYRYSFIADTDGKLLTCHVDDAIQVQVGHIVPQALAWLSAACTISAETEMGLVVSSFLHGETGSLFAQMTDVNNRFFVAVSFSSMGKLGVIKHKISELIPAVRRFTNVL